MGTPFKVAGEIKLMTVSQRQMAAALGLSTTRTNELINEGVLIRDESTAQGRLMLQESLQNYYLSRKTTAEGANFWAERALHEKAKRQMAEVKYQERCGSLYEASTVENFLLEMLIDFRNKLLGLGHKIAPQSEGLTAAQICALIDESVKEILKEVSEDVKEVRFRTEDISSLEAARDDDSIGVGGQISNVAL